jgi:hypothetical protein
MIEHAKYTEHGSIVAIIDGVEMTVPDNMANRHRQMLAEWEAEGNTIEPYTPPEPPPLDPLRPLTSRQLRLGLVRHGISLSSVETAIEAIEDPTDREVARIEWKYTTTFERSHPLVNQIGAALGLTPEQIDAMWAEAATR